MVAKYFSSRGKPSPKSRQDSFSAKLIFAEHARLLYNSLAPEGEKVKRSRSSYVLKMQNNKLLISINAQDMTAFKATLNTLIKGSELAVKMANG
ncbi:MAG: KEOPS complex subunit Pcc1 [Nanoarchaeota archaeon]